MREHRGFFLPVRVYINKVYRPRKKAFCNENVCFNILYRFFFVVKKNHRIFAPGFTREHPHFAGQKSNARTSPLGLY